MKNQITKTIGGIIFDLSSAKKLKEKDFEHNFARFLTIDSNSAWRLIQRFIDENKKDSKKMK